VHLGELAHQRQTDAEASLGPARRAVRLAEALENVRQKCRGDPLARVAHRDLGV
jgi:hypothetical protein